MIPIMPKVSGIPMFSPFIAFFFTNTKQMLVTMIEIIVINNVNKATSFIFFLCALINLGMISSGLQRCIGVVMSQFALICSLVP